MKKIIATALFSIVGITATQAQFEMSNLSIGAGYAPSLYFAAGSMTTSFSGKVQYEVEENFYFGDYIYSDKKYNDNANTRLTFQHLNVGMGRYLLGTADDDFNIAGKIGAGISMYDYNDDINIEATSDASWSINAGVAANYNISEALTLFAETGVIFSAGEYNSRGNTTADPNFNSLVFQLGARFRFR